MNKIILIISVVSIAIVVQGLTFVDYSTDPVPRVTQQDLREMIDEWMTNPQDDDREQRLEIMKSFYTFEESCQKLTDDQAGRVMLNQIRKMVSFDILKVELDGMKQEIRKELKQLDFNLES